MPRIFNQNQSQNLLTLTENRGFAFGEINKLAPDLSMEGVAFRLKKHLILKGFLNRLDDITLERKVVRDGVRIYG